MAKNNSSFLIDNSRNQDITKVPFGVMGTTFKMKNQIDK